VKRKTQVHKVLGGDEALERNARNSNSTDAKKKGKTKGVRGRGFYRTTRKGTECCSTKWGTERD